MSDIAKLIIIRTKLTFLLTFGLLKKSTLISPVRDTLCSNDIQMECVPFLISQHFELYIFSLDFDITNCKAKT